MMLSGMGVPEAKKKEAEELQKRIDYFLSQGGQIRQFTPQDPRNPDARPKEIKEINEMIDAPTTLL